MSTTIDRLDQVPAGDWSVVTVCRAEDSRKWDWSALLVDVPFEELKNCVCKVAFLWVHPDEYRPDQSRVAREVWVRIPGKHRNEDRAWGALQDMMAAPH